jgi:hypothetical protein
MEKLPTFGIDWIEHVFGLQATAMRGKLLGLNGLAHARIKAESRTTDAVFMPQSPELRPWRCRLPDRDTIARATAEAIRRAHGSGLQDKVPSLVERGDLPGPAGDDIVVRDRR